MKRVGIVILTMVIALLLGFCSSGDRIAAGTERDVSTVSRPVFRGDPTLSGRAEDSLPDRIGLLWSFQTGSEIISSPVLGFGRVFIASTDGKVYALSILAGEKIWEYDTGDDIEASPLLVDESIFVGNLSGDFYALSAWTGQFLWKFEAKNSIYGSANWASGSTPGQKLVFFGCYDNSVYCLDSETGKQVWAYETDNYINGAPATDGRHVIFGGCDELLHVISSHDGEKKGEIWAMSYIPGSPALVDGKAYLGHYNNKLICIDIAGQKILWEYEDKVNGGAFFSSPAVGKDRVIIGSRDGYLHCVERETGKRLWRFQTRDEIDGSPVLAGSKSLSAVSTAGCILLTSKTEKRYGPTRSELP